MPTAALGRSGPHCFENVRQGLRVVRRRDRLGQRVGLDDRHDRRRRWPLLLRGIGTIGAATSIAPSRMIRGTAR